MLLLAGGFALIALVALIRIAWLGVVQPAPTEHSMAQALLPPRGEITDRNGVPLARAFPAYALWYNPEALGDGGPPLVNPPALVATRLKAIFPDLDLAQTTRFLAAGKPGYLRRRVLPDEVNAVNAIGELALETPAETDRQYPQGKLAAHVLGYVASDGHGRVGMESFLDSRLLDPAERGKPVPLSSRRLHEILVTQSIVGQQLRATAAMDQTGNFVVSWYNQMLGDDGGVIDPREIYARRFAANGTPIANEFRVNTTTTGVQGKAVAAMDASGDFVVVWQSIGQDGSDSGIYAQRFNSSGVAQGARR